MDNKQIKILLFEDNPGDARLIEEMLKDSDLQFQMTRFERLQDGLAYLSVQDADILLLDLGLPDSQGVDTFKQANDRFPHIPIIVLTGNDDQQTATTAVRLGAQDYLVKGRIESDLVVRAIRYAIERKQSRSDLALEKAELDALITSIGDAVIAADTNCIITRMNPVAEMLTGWSLSEAKGLLLNNVFKIIGQESREELECPVRQIMETGQVSALPEQIVMISRNGTQISISSSVSLVKDQNGKTSGAVLVFHDETDQRMSQHLLQTRFSLIEYAASHSLNELLTEALDQISDLVESPIGFYHFVEADQKSLSLQAWSTKTIEKFCQAEGQDSHYPIEQAGVWADCVRLKETIIHNDYASLPNKKGMPQGHAQLTRELVVPVLWENKVVAVLGVGNKALDYTQKDADLTAYLADVTWHIVKQKITEEKIRESEQQFRQIVETAEEGIWLTDVDNKVTFTNQKMADWLGYTVEEMIGKNGLDFYFEEDQHIIKEKISDRKKGLSSAYEIKFRRKDSSPFWTIVNSAPIRDDKDQIKGTLIMVTDLSKRKVIEQQVVRERDRAQKYFAIAGVMLLVLDKDGIILQINERGLQILEYDSEDELLGKNWFETCIPKNFEDLNQFGEYKENPIVTKTGVEKSIAWHNTKLWGDDRNEIIGILSSGEDITERLQDQREIEMLLMLSRKAGSETNLDDLLFLIADQIVDVIPSADAATIFLYEEKDQVVRIQAWSGYDDKSMKGIEFSTKVGQTGRIFQSKKSEIIDDVSKEKAFIIVNNTQISQVKCNCGVPLIFNDRVIGIIYSDSFTKTNAFNQKDLDLLESIGNQLSGEIQNARLLDQVTEQHHQLQVERDKAQNYLNIAGVMIMTMDAAGVITGINHKGAQVLGYQIDDLVGQDWFSTCVPAADAKRVRQLYDQFISGNGKPGDHFEQVVITKTGAERIFDLVSIEILDENKKIIGALSSGEDITDKKHIQRTLEDSESKLRNIFENSTNMFYAHTIDRHLTFVSPQSKLILGYEPEELVSQSTDVLAGSLTNEEAINKTIKAIQSGKRQSPSEMQLRAKNGDFVWVEVREVPIVVDGKTVSIVGSLNDITARKIADLERERTLDDIKVANEDLQNAYTRVQSTMEATIRTIAQTVEVRDPYTAGHHQRVSELAVAIAVHMELDQESIKAIGLTGILHDLGKIQVPAEILSKPGKLSEIEFSLIKTHPTVGYNLIKNIEFPWPLADILHQHHEKMDGSGYPLGLKGDQISLEGRILAVADTVEAMSSHRPYRPALGIEAALNQIKADRAALYDPDVVDACLQLFENGYQMPTA